MSRFQEMQTFVQVVDRGSITAAADRLGVAKSAVSRRLRDLESRLGVQLIQRTTRRLHLTDVGREFYDRCLRLLDELEEAELSVSESHGDLAGPVRLAAPSNFGHEHLGEAICEFNAMHPAIVFDIDFNDRQIDLLAEGFDLAIRIADLEDSSLIARRIASTTLHVVASPSYIEEHGAPATPDDLRQHRGLVYTNAARPGVWRYVGPDGRQGEVEVPATLRASSGTFLADAASAGQGIAIEPDFIAHRAIRDGRLVSLLTDWSWPTLSVYAVYPPTRYLTRRVRALIDFLADRFADGAPWDCEG